MHEEEPSNRTTQAASINGFDLNIEPHEVVLVRTVISSCHNIRSRLKHLKKQAVASVFNSKVVLTVIDILSKKLKKLKHKTLFSIF